MKRANMRNVRVQFKSASSNNYDIFAVTKIGWKDTVTIPFKPPQTKSRNKLLAFSPEVSYTVF
jgi:hypothetical protein